MKRVFLLVVAVTLCVSTALAWKVQGEEFTFQISNTKCYPGTVRDVTVYVPSLYDGEAPAALYVGLDGNLYNAISVIDSLITARELPVMIGVFVKPGRILDIDGEVIRYNRSNEFDRVNGNLASFLETEVLPRVEATKTPSGKKIKITDNPNMRAITGASSSGIAAFTAAWFRPDLFRRVYSACGTFVDMRGGDRYAAIIRKTEPKPIKIFLQDGEKDAWNPLFCHWFEENVRLESALRFAGYDVEHEWGDGCHSIAHGTKIFPKVIKWLWQGDTVRAGKSQNNCLSDILTDGEGWQRADTIVVNDSKEVFAVSPDKRHRVEALKGKNILVDYILDNGNCTFGQDFYWLDGENVEVFDLEFDTAGNLYCATSAGIQVCDRNGRVRAILPSPVCGRYTIAFIGENCSYLHVQGGDKAYMRKMAIPGWNPSLPAIKVKDQGEG